MLLVLIGALFHRPLAAATEEDRFTVVTFNLWHDKGNWPKRRTLIVRELQRLQPDVIALQEVLQDDGLPNQAATLATALDYRHVFVSVDAPTATRRYGNALLTRHPIVAQGSKALKPLDDFRNLAYIRIMLGSSPLDIYATHLHFTGAGGAIRREQIADLLGYVRATNHGVPSIVVGDFNAPVDATEFTELRATYHDAYDGLHAQAPQDAPAHSTLNPSYLPPLRVDHVLFDPATLTVVSARRILDVPDADGTWASDHFGVFATLRFTAPPTR